MKGLVTEISISDFFLRIMTSLNCLRAAYSIYLGTRFMQSVLPTKSGRDVMTEMTGDSDKAVFRGL